MIGVYVKTLILFIGSEVLKTATSTSSLETPKRMTLPPDRAFVVQFSGDTDPDRERMRGRAEHLESGRRCRFNSLAQLLEFMNERLRDAARAAGDESYPRNG